MSDQTNKREDIVTPNVNMLASGDKEDMPSEMKGLDTAVKGQADPKIDSDIPAQDTKKIPEDDGHSPLK